MNCCENLDSRIINPSERQHFAIPYRHRVHVVSVFVVQIFPTERQLPRETPRIRACRTESSDIILSQHTKEGGFGKQVVHKNSVLHAVL